MYFPGIDPKEYSYVGKRNEHKDIHGSIVCLNRNIWKPLKFPLIGYHLNKI